MPAARRPHPIAWSAALTVLVASLLVMTEATAPSAAADTPTGLTWQPPVGYQDFEPIQIPSSGGVLRLDDRTDYILHAPDRITGTVLIVGGRHVVWIGGHVDIDACCDGGPSNRMAVIVVDGPDPVRDRVVHLEGLHLEGDHLSEGIDTNADLAIIQIQNVRVDNLRLAAGGHPDVIQTWGSYGELRVDRLTGRTNYQGLFLRVDMAYHPRGGDIFLRRVNLEAFKSADSTGHTLYSMWNDSIGRVHTDQVYSDAHPDGRYGPGADDATVLVENDLRVNPTTVGGRMTWPDHPSKVRTFEGDRMGSVQAGAPPEGDFVPASVVGLGYVSPGYGNPDPTPDPTTTTTALDPTTTTTALDPTTTTTAPDPTTTTTTPDPTPDDDPGDKVKKRGRTKTKLIPATSITRKQWRNFLRSLGRSR